MGGIIREFLADFHFLWHNAPYGIQEENRCETRP